MNDLKNGILDINGFLVNPNTKVEELETHFSLPAEHEPPFAFWNFSDRIFLSEGVSFAVFITFDEGNLKKVVLRPQFPEIADKYDLTPYSNDWLPYYQEIRAIMDEWLEKQLGTPTFKSDRVTEYNFEKVLLGTDSYIDTRDRDYCVQGGSIDIYYR